MFMMTEKMNFIDKFCCICMNERDLKYMSDVDSEGVSLYDKLTSSVVEMNFKEMNDQRLICEGCCVTLNTVYIFRQMCLRSKANLITYVSQLQTYSPVRGTLSAPLREVMAVKEETKIKCENEDNIFEENNMQDEFQTGSYEESVNFPASIKRECESEEDASFTNEEATVDHVDERGHSDVKAEDIARKTMMEDENYTEFSDIGSAEDPLAVKEEPVSDTEPPRDGTTSQGGVGISGEPKETIQNEPKQKKAARRSHTCEICAKSFNHKWNLNNHLRIHSGEKPYTCEICKKNFIQKVNLTRHLLMHSTEKLYECEICKKSFNQKREFIGHMKTHSGERPNECEICKKRFTNKGNLNKHMRNHSGERPYECEICKKSFNQKSILTLHLLMHSDERPYECEVCEKSFKHKCNLNNHMQIHSVERSYVCEICKKGFNYKGNLTKHMRIHSGEKPYECEICKRNFIQKNILNNHLLMHSGERPYECGVCEKSFIQKTSLTRHVLKHSMKVDDVK